MAKRKLRPRHQDEIREKIQVSNLITRVQKYALGELGDEDISSNRLNAIKLLLSKTLPDLSSVEHSTDPDNPLSIKHTLDTNNLTDDQLRAIASIPLK